MERRKQKKGDVPNGDPVRHKHSSDKSQIISGWGLMVVAAVLVGVLIIYQNSIPGIVTRGDTVTLPPKNNDNYRETSQSHETDELKPKVEEAVVEVMIQNVLEEDEEDEKKSLKKGDKEVKNKSPKHGVKEEMLKHNNLNAANTAEKKQAGRADKGGVTYDGYVALAAEHQWSPQDPMEKLMSVAVTYNQMFELQPPAGEAAGGRLLQMVDKEVKFVLDVLLASRSPGTRRTAAHYSPPSSSSPGESLLDLTPVLFEAIDGVHRGIVRAGKQLLVSGGQGVAVVTRQQAEAASMKHQYGLVFALLRLVPQASTPASLSLSLQQSPAPAPPLAFAHLFVDIERELGRYSLGALGSATALRLHRLYEPLVMLGADCAPALLAAVRNADDLSLSMLLHLAHSQPRKGARVISSSDLLAALALASSLKFPHLVERLQRAVDTEGGEEGTSPPVPFYNDFMAVRTRVSDEAGVEKGEGGKRGGSEDAAGGYVKSRLIPAAQGSQKESQSQRQGGGGGQCDVQVLLASSHKVVAEAEQSFRQGRPVVLRGLLDGVIARGGWSLEALRRTSRTIKVTPSLIPYGDQLGGSGSSRGQQRGAVSLRKYLDTMREYTAKVQLWEDAALVMQGGQGRRLELSEGGGLAGAAEFLAQSGLPLYVFDNQLLPPGTPLQDLVATPFPGSRGRGSDGEEEEEEEDAGMALLRALIAAAARATYTVKNTSSSARSPQSSTRQFFMGPALSGAPFHYHGPAFNALLYGRKLWHLLPPGRDLYSNVPPLQWASAMEAAAPGAAADLYPYLQQGQQPQEAVLPCYVLQQAGDVLFVPNMWSHQITNLDETVGFATELHAAE